MDGEMSPCEHGDWVRFEVAYDQKNADAATIETLTKERDARQALLEDVFGKDCIECEFSNVTHEGDYQCGLCRGAIGYDGRRDDCPFNPFDAKRKGDAHV